MQHFLPLLILLASCTSNASYVQSGSYYSVESRPIFALLPMSDQTTERHMEKTAHLFSEEIASRILLKRQLHFQRAASLSEAKEKGALFAIATDLIEHDEITQRPTELSIGIFVRIFDLRGESPEVLYQEVVAHNTLLQTNTSIHSPNFRITPLGLAYAKISREVASYIEDFSILATKGTSR